MGEPLRRDCLRYGRIGECSRVGEAVRADLPAARGHRSRDGLPPPVPRGERPQAMAAIAGIDIALWDVKGKAAGLPVYRLLGGENRPIFTYATGGYYRPDALDADYGRELAQFIELGYRGKAQDRRRHRCCGSPADRCCASSDWRRGSSDAGHERRL